MQKFSNTIIFWIRFIFVLVAVKPIASAAIPETPESSLEKRQTLFGPEVGSPWVLVTAGRWIEVDGHYFTVNGQLTIDFYLDGDIHPFYTSGVSISGGNFISAVQIPSSVPGGTHTIGVGVNGVKASFTIQICGATATCNPVIGYLDTTTNFARTSGLTEMVGNTFVLVGNGFQPGENLQLWMDRWYFLHGMQLGSATVNPGGFFQSGLLTIPNIQSGLQLYGEHILSAVGPKDEATMWMEIDQPPR